jgi:hypothetical protein
MAEILGTKILHTIHYVSQIICFVNFLLIGQALCAFVYNKQLRKSPCVFANRSLSLGILQRNSCRSWPQEV